MSLLRLMSIVQNHPRISKHINGKKYLSNRLFKRHRSSKHLIITSFSICAFYVVISNPAQQILLSFPAGARSWRVLQRCLKGCRKSSANGAIPTGNSEKYQERGLMMVYGIGFATSYYRIS